MCQPCTPNNAFPWPSSVCPWSSWAPRRMGRMGAELGALLSLGRTPRTYFYFFFNICKWKEPAGLGSFWLCQYCFLKIVVDFKPLSPGVQRSVRLPFCKVYYTISWNNLQALFVRPFFLLLSSLSDYFLYNLTNFFFSSTSA